MDTGKKSRRLFGLIPMKDPKVFLGHVILEENRWTFSIFGREYASFAMELAEKMANRFKVKIKVVLKSEGICALQYPIYD